MSRPGDGGVTVAVIGLGFGAAFLPLYLSHPQVSRVVAVDSDRDRLAQTAATFGIEQTSGDVREVLDDPAVDAVHLVTPVSTHADLTVTALDAGKHVGCAVPLATSLGDVRRVLEAKARSGRTYMMMETAVFAREHRAIARMLAACDLGELTHYRGFHIQNLDGFPAYWQGFPPMHYATHALAPVLSLLGTTVQRVTGTGSGRLASHRRIGGYTNDFPTEVALFTMHHSPIVADVTVAFSQTARAYVEGYNVYGTRRGVEWPFDNVGPLTVHDMAAPEAGCRGNPVTTWYLHPPDEVADLPAALRPFVAGATYQAATGRQIWVEPHHGGSHAFLVHEFVDSIISGRDPVVDVQTAADWTVPGICAHESAMAGGITVEVPQLRA